MTANGTSRSILRYPKNDTPELDLDLFRNPSAEYRGAPFWAWNGRLEHARLVRQIAVFKAMGMGGFHMHPRTGLATEYLGDEFMHLVRLCVEEAERQNMLAWLYDEDRYPSGFAGGLVTQDPQMRAQYLRLVPHVLEEGGAHHRRFFARYHVVLEADYLKHYRRLETDESVGEQGTLWYAYLERWMPSTWYNGQSYVDTLNPTAIQRFVDITHERYAQTVGEYFGRVIPAIFSDEPQFTKTRPLAEPTDADGAILPWTDDLPVTFHAWYGTRLEDRLPELVWGLPSGAASVVRYQFYDHVAERLAQAFGNTVGEWCERHGIALTGHVMDEDHLGPQTAVVGETMRMYRRFGLPGIDMLCDWREYNTAKQAQSVAHQYGRPGVLSELYGVTNWDFSFAQHKAQGDWQAALGVTTRVHHLAWYTMAGEAKRDYPASIGYQSPWYHAYHLVEDYFARLNTALTRGHRLVRVGVIHPIESYWLCTGPLSQTADEREERERAFDALTDWLLLGQIDFDFVAESMLPTMNSSTDTSRFVVGAAAYDVVVVPGLRTLRSTTLERLERFAAAGGAVVFVGEVPALVDALPSSRAQELARRSIVLPWSRRQLLAQLSPYRDISVEHPAGMTRSVLYQLRLDGHNRVLFLVNTDAVVARPRTTIRIRGEWSATVLDALTGQDYRVQTELDDDMTRLVWDFPAHGSLLLLLEPGWAPQGLQPQIPQHQEVGPLADPVPITLSEPNVLVLNHARYRLDDEPWQPVDEVLRIDTALRERLGLPRRWEESIQPWADTSPMTTPHRLELAFKVDMDVAVEAPFLALENAASTTILLNGQPVASDVVGWYVDEAIQTVALPRLERGSHEITLQLPYGSRAEPEWCYLLGEFGVELHGRHARVVAQPTTLAFGDWTRQGLPFYAGNVTYHCSFTSDTRRMVLRASQFAGPLLAICVDGRDRRWIAFAPFEDDLGELDAGAHTLDIKVYGNRVNAFGALHNADVRSTWHGPDSWRTSGDAWADEYQIKPMGLLGAPVICSG